LASTNREVERSTTVIAGVELSAVSECTLVVDIDVVSWRRAKNCQLRAIEKSSVDA